MPPIDLGDAPPSPDAPRAPGPARCKLTWTVGGAARTLHLFLTSTVEAGRHSSRPLCLRVEPSSDPANLEKSKKISGHHFTLRGHAGAVELSDAGSSNGTFLGKERLPPHQPRRLDGPAVVAVADVLELELQPVFSGGSGFLRIQRKNNPTSEEYAMLFTAGRIGPSPDALVRLDDAGGAPRRRKGPTFDTGEAPGGDPANLLLRDGRLYLERTGGDTVSFAGQALQPGQTLPLGGGDLTVAGVLITVEV